MNFIFDIFDHFIFESKGEGGNMNTHTWFDCALEDSKKQKTSFITGGRVESFQEGTHS